MSPSFAAASSSVSTPSAQAHPPLAAELVDEERVLRALRVLEEERRPAGLDDAVRDLGDLDVGVRLRPMMRSQLACALEERDPLAEGLEVDCVHGARQSMDASAYSTASSTVSARPASQA
jgi:hypothetical protein